MEGDNPRGSNPQLVLMAFGLPIMTTAIVIGSMYAGHIITTKSDRPTNVLVETAAPKIDVNVPQAAAPNVQVTAATPKVDVHVPQSPPAAVTVNTPQAAPPNITIAPATPQVTVIDRREERPLPPAIAKDASLKKEATTEPGKDPATPGTEPAKTETPTAADAKTTTPPTDTKPTPTLPTAKPQSSLEPASATDVIAAAAKTIATPGVISNSTPGVLAQAKPGLTDDQLTLETLYSYAAQYIDAYCRKNNLNPTVEEKKWLKQWKDNLEQAMNDNIDSSEQSYINRIVILKRDHFDLGTAKPDKIVEACRILLRYRDGQLVWLKAMRDALTKDNLKKTVTLLAAGP